MDELEFTEAESNMSASLPPFIALHLKLISGIEWSQLISSLSINVRLISLILLDWSKH